MLDLVFRNSTKEKISSDFFGRIFKMASEFTKLKGRVELSLNLVGSSKIKILNFKYRKKNRPTDVLSFPIQDDKLRKYDILQLGDIFICPSFVKNQAKEQKIKYQEELSRVAIHGFLHLLGYDHELSDKEEKKMIGLQEKILNKLI